MADTTFQRFRHATLSSLLNIIFIASLAGCSQNDDVQSIDRKFEVNKQNGSYENGAPVDPSLEPPKMQAEGKCGEGKCGGMKKAGEDKYGKDKGIYDYSVEMPAPSAGKGWIVPVYFGTNREKSVPDSEYRYFSGKRGQGLVSYGISRVNIPPEHSKGKLERPFSILSFDFSENPDKHVVLIGQPEELSEIEFFNQLRIRVENAGDNSAFVFVHGFNVTFEDSILRTGQLAYDLSIKGPAIAFSWPSEGKTVQYLVDGVNNESTIPYLEKFLTDIREQTGAEKMHVLAHSMGNRAFTSALRKIAQKHNSPYFNQVVLAAPDIDAEVFRTQIAPEIKGSAERITLYASANDKALMVSSGISGDYPRAGQAGEDLVVVDGIDTIDVSSINSGWLGAITLGHSDYGDELIDDIFHLFRNGLAPNERNLIPLTKDGHPYWAWR